MLPDASSVTYNSLRMSSDRYRRHHFNTVSLHEPCRVLTLPEIVATNGATEALQAMVAVVK